MPICVLFGIMNLHFHLHLKSLNNEVLIGFLNLVTTCGSGNASAQLCNTHDVDCKVQAIQEELMSLNLSIEHMETFIRGPNCL